MKNMRHVVNVMRPTKATGTLGELQGQPEIVCEKWPCSIKPISGNESESARQNAPGATFAVEGYGDPKWKDLEQCYLTGGSIGERRLNIAFVDDENLNGVKLRLLCG